MEFNDTESQLEGIRELFETARTEDGWDVTGEMLYSFYFVDRSVEKLQKLGENLETDNLDFIDIFEIGDEETKEPTGEYLLHIDQITSYTPESLAEMNVKFQKLAEEYDIDSYDGWEFGEVGEEEEFDDDEVFDDEIIEDE